MHSQDFFYQALIYLLAAVISVPLAKRLGLGSVLGYLIAGVIIGPFVLGLIGEEGSDIMHFAEFGVTMMLFLIGLELKPSLLWKMRRSILGLGGMQVLLTAIVISSLALLFGLRLNQSITVGIIFSLSSTAIVLQSLTEKGLLRSEGGQSSFSVLLFQDISVIPILAIIPLLASKTSLEDPAMDPHTTFDMQLNAWQELLLIVGIVIGIILIGRFVAKYIFRIIANTGLREIFTATALLLVIAIALAMAKVGLSPALGTFLAGVVLADNEYRHELETDIEPFKGLLLGLFFIAVGAGINFHLFVEFPGTIVLLLFLLIIIKFGILFGLGRFFGLRSGQELLLSFSLAQGGEFAFVIISYTQQHAILNEFVSNILLIVVALSMAATPLLLIINEKIIQPLYQKNREETLHDEIEEHGNPVIIAGFGRVGVMVGRFLAANGIMATILDNDPKNIAILRKFGHKVYYGDASRHDLLDSAGATEAKVLILALDESEKILEIVDFVQKKYPKLKIISRAVDVKHSFELRDKKIQSIIRETYSSSIDMGVQALISLGFYKFQSKRAARIFKHYDDICMDDLYSSWGKDKKHYIKHARHLSEELERIFVMEEQKNIHVADHAWDVESLREEVKEYYAQMNEQSSKKK